MQFDKPRVTLGLPVFNGAKYLSRILESVKAQTFGDYELLISDNASTDDTPQICARFAELDSRIIYRRNDTNVGLALNHNVLVDRARGEYFKWLGHDDECLPTMLSRCVEALDAAPSTVSMVYTAVEKIDESGNSLGMVSDPVASSDTCPAQRLSRFIRYASIYNFAFGLMRVEMLRKTRLHGLFPMSDQVLFAELAMLGELREIREPLYRLRLHPGRSFQANATSQARRELFDPSQVGRRAILSIENRVHAELIASGWRMPREFHHKLLCVIVALVVPPWLRFRDLSGRWRVRVLHGLRATSCIR